MAYDAEANAHTMAGQRQGSKEGEAAQQEIVQEKVRTNEGEAAISRHFAAEEEVDWRCTPPAGRPEPAGHDRRQNCTCC